MQRAAAMMRAVMKTAPVWRRLATPLLLCGLLAPAGHGVAAEPTVAVAVDRRGDALVIDATFDVEASADAAWDVLTDFEHMAAFYPNLRSSRVLHHDGDTWVVRQEGVASYGLVSLPFESVRELRLEPKRRVLARNLSGTLKRMESRAVIDPLAAGVEIKYHAEIEPDSLLARWFGAGFARHEAEEQLTAMAREMIRRQARSAPPVAGAAPPGHGS